MQADAVKLVNLAKAWWWLVRKDLLREYRAPKTIPALVLLGLVLALVIHIQIDLPREWERRVVSGLFWVVTFFAGTVALERSFAGERDDGCWQALALYPTPAFILFLAKLCVNFLWLAALDAVLLPAFLLFARGPLFPSPGGLLAVLCAANLGYAAAGTLISALTHRLEQRGDVLVLLLLPLVLPVMLAAARATWLLTSEDLLQPWWWWWQLLAVFALLYCLFGALLFDYVIEDG